MARSFQVTFDCGDPAALAGFWAEVMEYVLEPPPPGYDSWEALLKEANVPEDQWDRASAIVDPEGAGPRFFFQKVPEGKKAKNRMHLDVRGFKDRDAPKEEGSRQLNAAADRLVALGATKHQEFEEMGSHWIVMQDPEGNEFCIA
ncbi:MAG: hypothetical protein QOH90_1766 [Actinomycetota bacterium]|nr:hypothetical protein [Actinomycetota bacterium]